MSKLFAIAGKELRVYFTTLVAWAGIGAYAFLLGLLFVGSLNRFQQLTDAAVTRQDPALLERLNVNELIIQPTLSSSVWMFLFFIPFLTMRLFAEERAERTFELLMSAPVRTIDMVLGKFFAVATLIAILAGLALVFPIVLDAYTEGPGGGSGVEWAPVLSGVGLVFALGLTFGAIGLFFSALATSPIVAALSSFAALLGLFILPVLAQRVEGDWREVLEAIAPVNHLTRGLGGRVHVRDLVYFATVTLTFLFFTHRVVESERWR
jgi:ABC-2 type transport system permease protein